MWPLTDVLFILQYFTLLLTVWCWWATWYLLLLLWCYSLRIHLMLGPRYIVLTLFILHDDPCYTFSHSPRSMVMVIRWYWWPPHFDPLTSPVVMPVVFDIWPHLCFLTPPLFILLILHNFWFYLLIWWYILFCNLRCWFCDSRCYVVWFCWFCCCISIDSRYPCSMITFDYDLLFILIYLLIHIWFYCTHSHDPHHHLRCCDSRCCLRPLRDPLRCCCWCSIFVLPFGVIWLLLPDLRCYTFGGLVLFCSHWWHLFCCLRIYIWFIICYLLFIPLRFTVGHCYGVTLFPTLLFTFIYVFPIWLFIVGVEFDLLVCEYPHWSHDSPCWITFVVTLFHCSNPIWFVDPVLVIFWRGILNYFDIYSQLITFVPSIWSHDLFVVRPLTPCPLITTWTVRFGCSPLTHTPHFVVGDQCIYDR